MIVVPRGVVREYVLQHFKNCKSRKSGREIEAECAICGDSKKRPGKKRRFNYNLHNNWWHCFNCGEGGRDFISLVATLEQIPYAQAIQKFKHYFLENIESFFNESDETEEEQSSDEFEIVRFLSQQCFPLRSKIDGLYKKGLQYLALQELRARKVSSKDWPFYICFSGPWRGRLIIPFYEHELPVYFQGRALPKKLDPKYRNCPIEKENLIIFKDDLHPEMDIYVFEGFWEALILNSYLHMNATSILGRSVNWAFIQKLLEMTSKNVIICFDNFWLDEPALEELKKTIEEFPKNFTRVKFFIWKQKDHKDISDVFVEGIDVKDILEENQKDYLETKLYLEINNLW